MGRDPPIKAMAVRVGQQPANSGHSRYRNDRRKAVGRIAERASTPRANFTVTEEGPTNSLASRVAHVSEIIMSHAVPTLLHGFEVGQLPALAKESVRGLIEAEPREPAFRGAGAALPVLFWVNERVALS